MARSTSAAATDESTPPESPQTACPVGPTLRATAATASSAKPAMVQAGWQPQMRNRKFARISPPRGVWATSGWNCTPQNFRPGAATAAAGQLALSPTTENPAAAIESCRRGSSTPGFLPRGEAVEQVTGTGADLHRGPPVLASRGRHHFAAQQQRRQLDAVTVAEHRLLQLAELPWRFVALLRLAATTTTAHPKG